MSVNQMKVKEYTCSIQNDKFLFMNFMNAVSFIDLRNNEKVYFINTSINFSNFQSVTLSSRIYKSIKA